VSFHNLDCFLTGMTPERCQKSSGKKKNKKKRAGGEGKQHASEERTTAPVERATASSAPDPSPEEVARLKRALDSEQRGRAELETRLRDLEARLQDLLAHSTDATAAAVREDLALLDLQAQLQFELEVQEHHEALDVWLQEASMRADDRARALHDVPVQQPVAIPEPVQAPAAVSAGSDDRLREARLAIEAAEARAAHNASQVRKLTEELAAARADLMRTSSRLRDLDARLSTSERTLDSARPAVADLPPALDDWAARERRIDDEQLALDWPAGERAKAVQAPEPEVETESVSPVQTPFDDAAVSPFDADEEVEEVAEVADVEEVEEAVEPVAPVEASDETPDLASELLAWGGTEEAEDEDATGVDPLAALADAVDDIRETDQSAPSDVDLESALLDWGDKEEAAEASPAEPDTAPAPEEPSEEEVFGEDEQPEGDNSELFDALTSALGEHDEPEEDVVDLTEHPVDDSRTIAEHVEEIAAEAHEFQEVSDAAAVEEVETLNAEADASELEEIPLPEPVDEDPAPDHAAVSDVLEGDLSTATPAEEETDDAAVTEEDFFATVQEIPEQTEATPSEDEEPLESSEEAQPDFSGVPDFEDEVGDMEVPEIHPDDQVSEYQESTFDSGPDESRTASADLLDAMTGDRARDEMEQPAAAEAEETPAPDASPEPLEEDFTPEPAAERSAPTREGISRNLRGWSGVSEEAPADAPAEKPAASVPVDLPESEPRDTTRTARPEGKRAMMNALMRFMGDDDEPGRGRD
jgi:hypothetical protein